MARIFLTLMGVKWTANSPVEDIFLTDAEYAATEPDGAEPLDENHPQYAVGNRWFVVKPARKRRVRYTGKGVTGSGKSVRKIKGVTVDAADAARYAGLNADETALFVSRFPDDGTTAPAPKDIDAVSAVFLKVLDTPKRMATLDLSDAGNVDLS